jgi:hypothetical protein
MVARQSVVNDLDHVPLTVGILLDRAAAVADPEGSGIRICGDFAGRHSFGHGNPGDHLRPAAANAQHLVAGCHPQRAEAHGRGVQVGADANGLAGLPRRHVDGRKGRGVRIQQPRRLCGPARRSGPPGSLPAESSSCARRCRRRGRTRRCGGTRSRRPRRDRRAPRLRPAWLSGCRMWPPPGWRWDRPEGGAPWSPRTQIAVWPASMEAMVTVTFRWASGFPVTASHRSVEPGSETPPIQMEPKPRLPPSDRR